MTSKTSSKHIYDDLDRALTSLLRADGRAPISKLAEDLGVARGTVQNRIDRMLDTGALLGFTARVREDYSDKAIKAIMMIEVTGNSTTQVIKKLRGLPELHSLHTTNGKWDLVAEIIVEDLAAFDNVLRIVRMTDGVLNSDTSLLLTTI